jgi:hypothetical protein
MLRISIEIDQGAANVTTTPGDVAAAPMPPQGPPPAPGGATPAAALPAAQNAGAAPTGPLATGMSAPVPFVTAAADAPLATPDALSAGAGPGASLEPPPFETIAEEE